MSDEFKPSLGEVYRICSRIELAVKEQNGRIGKLERDALRIKTLWSAFVVAVAIFGDSIRARLGL